MGDGNQATIQDLMEVIKQLQLEAAEYRQQQQQIQQHQRTIADAIVQLQQQGSPSNRQNQRKEDELKLSDMPTFEGDSDPESYLDWERRMERLFKHKNLDDNKRFDLAILKLTKYASHWFESYQNMRIRDSKQELATWTDLKVKMRKKFVPRSHKQDLYMRLTDLTQGKSSVATYTQEFERLFVACECKDEEEQKIAKYVHGLEPRLKFQVQLQPLTTFDDTCSLAARLESQSAYYKAGYHRPKSDEHEQNAAAAPSSFSRPEKQKEKGVTDLQLVPSTLGKGQDHMKQIVCYKCQGMGHLSKNCPNKAMVTREEYTRNLLANQEEQIAHEQQLQLFSTQDVTSASFWSSQPKCTPIDEDEILVVRRAMITQEQEEEDPQRCNLFRSKCLINDNVCSFIVDSGSCTNCCALALVDKLQLPTRKHPRSYKLSWLNDDNGLWVKKQALVNFKVGEYEEQIWVDVIPMSACALLLGRPWQSDREVMHNGRTNEYSVLVGNRRFVLQPLPPKRVTSKAENSGYNEAFNSTSSKKERRQQMLQLRKGSDIEVGDRVWLTLFAQLKHSKTKDEPIDEGPFEVLEKVGCEAFKVDLGGGVLATLTSDDLVRCETQEWT